MAALRSPTDESSNEATRRSIWLASSALGMPDSRQRATGCTLDARRAATAPRTCRYRSSERRAETICMQVGMPLR